MRWEERQWIGEILGDRVLERRMLAGGYSHETWLFVLSERSVVVRMGMGEHGIEAAVMAAAGRHVPVPGVIAVTAATADQPHSMMLLDYVAGTPLDRVLTDESLSHRDFHALGEEVGRVAAGISAVRFDRPGFFDDSELTLSDKPPWSQQLPVFAERCMTATPDERLELSERAEWAELCATHAPVLSAVDDQARLVHSDMNPKNLLVSRISTGWRVDAVLDWEFSYSGCPYADAANMVRFGGDYPQPFLRGFVAAFADHLPEDLGAPAEFGYLGRVLDMFALSDLVTRAPGHPVADRAARQIRQWLADGVPVSL